MDQDGDGRFDSGEGVAGVPLQLFRSGENPLSATPTATTQSAAGGLYNFGDLSTGTYFVLVPAAAFQPGAPLENMFSLPGESVNADDDQGEDGIDTEAPARSGVRSRLIFLYDGALPSAATFETGHAASDDDAADRDGDLTVDFGFLSGADAEVGVGGTVFKDANANGKFDEGDSPLASVPVQLFDPREDPNRATARAKTVTDAQGRYLIADIAPGRYIVHVPASAFSTSERLFGLYATEGRGGDSGSDDDRDENTLDPVSPVVTGVSSVMFALTPGQEPTSGAEGTENGDGATRDDANDANVDLTIDLGFRDPPTPLGRIGNFVFNDRDGDGRGSLGEGIAGVVVQLFRDTDDLATASPLAERTSDAAGFYVFDQLAFGRYVVRVSPAMFAAGAPLNGMLSVGSTDGSAGDDDVGEDGLDAANPALTGIRTAVIDLATSGNPVNSSFETGVDNQSDDAFGQDNLADLTIDLGFRAANRLPSRFAVWQAEQMPNGQSGASANPDGDAFANLLEYYFLGDAMSGLQGTPLIQIRSLATGGAELSFARRAGGVSDLIVKCMVTNRLGADSAWTVSGSWRSTSTPGAGGREQVTVEDIFAQSGAEGGSQLFVRLALCLDANGDQVPEAVAYTPIFGASRQVLAGGLTNTFSIPFARPSIFTGTVERVSSGELRIAGTPNISPAVSQGTHYMMEVLTGEHQGQYWEVDEGLTSDRTLVLDLRAAHSTLATVPSSLVGASVTVRPMWTLGDAFPAERMTGGNNATASDNVMFYTANGYLTYWLVAAGNVRRWLRSGVSVGVDQASARLGPHEGMFVKPRGTDRLVMVVGEVREVALRLPLRSGFSFVGSPLTQSSSFASNGMTVAKGFLGGRNATVADRLLAWNVDSGGVESWSQYYLFASGNVERWLKSGSADLSDQSQQPFIKPFRAVFMRRSTDLLGWAPPASALPPAPPNL